MKRFCAAVLCAALAWSGAAFAQQTDDDPDTDGDNGGFTLTPELDLENVDEFGRVEEVEQEQVASGDGAVLRVLDKISGDITDLEMGNGQDRAFSRLALTLGECRYPKGNPAGDAYAYLVIRYERADRPVFEGWMIASSPALNALDHPRYDVWVLRCITS